MAEATRRFTVIDGSTAEQKQHVFVDTGIVDESGKRVFRPHPSGGDGGDGSMKLTLPDLRWNVALLNGLALIFTGALVGMFLWMVDRIDDRFDAADNKISTVSERVGDLRVDIANQSGDIKAILEKVDANQPQKSPDGE